MQTPMTKREVALPFNVAERENFAALMIFFVSPFPNWPVSALSAEPRRSLSSQDLPEADRPKPEA